MELDELQNLWKEDNKKLESRLELNEKILNKMNMDKTVGEFDKLISKSILGRNMALVYCIATLIFSSIYIEKLAYSIPAIIGSMAMLWSFVDHLSITKPDYSRISLIELQKSISNFRIHTSKTEKYDIAIVVFWQITAVPLTTFAAFKILIFSSLKYFSIYCLYCIVYTTLTIAFSRKTYATYDQKLKEAESDLEKIKAFESV